MIDGIWKERARKALDDIMMEERMIHGTLRVSGLVAIDGMLSIAF